MKFSTSCSCKILPILLVFFALVVGCSQTKQAVVKDANYTNTGPRVAVLPIYNLTGNPVNIKNVRESLVKIFISRGINVLPDEDLESFMARHRIRFTGGVNSREAAAFHQESVADFILITSLELYSEAYPPKIAIASRLVSAEGNPKILWTHNIGFAGDRSPGLLGLGMIKDPEVLLERVAENLSDSLAGYLFEQRDRRDAVDVKRKYKPVRYYRSTEVGPDFRERDVSFSLPISSGGEDSTLAEIEVRLSSKTSRTVTVEYEALGGTAAGAGTDYTLSRGTLSFSPGETKKSIEIEIVDDEIDEDYETIQVKLSNPINAFLGGTVLHTYTIVDNDSKPSASFEKPGQSVMEGEDTASLLIELSSPSGKTVIVPYSVIEGTTAGAGTDHTLKDGDLIFSPGERQKLIEFKIVDDTLDEDNETIYVVLGLPTNADRGSIIEHIVSIIDDDVPPRESLSGPLAVVGTADEGTGPIFEHKEAEMIDIEAPEISFGIVTFQGPGEGFEGNTITVDINLSKVSDREIKIPFIIAGTAAEGADYTISQNPLTISPGEKRGALTISVVDDQLDEDEESITVSMNNPLNAILGKRTVLKAKISDDDAKPTVGFTSAGQNATEKTGSITASAKLSVVSGRNVMVPLTISGTATDSVDYTAGPGTLLIRAGSMNEDLTITIMDDTLHEKEEEINVIMGAPVNAISGNVPVHKVNIIDDDPEPQVAFQKAIQVVEEGRGAIEVPVQLSNISDNDVSVPFSLNGSADAESDYVVNTPSPLIITAGTTSSSIIIAAADDRAVEGDETVIITIGTPVNAVSGMISQHTITIKDDDTRVLAVFPFYNRSSRKYAGEIMPLHFLRPLIESGKFTILEPGVVRDSLLYLRVILDDGISLANADLAFQKLDADYILTGRVLDYYDYEGPTGSAVVGFSLLVIEKQRRKVIWLSRSHNTGDDSVFLFDWGKVHTANELASYMSNAVIDLMLK